MNMQHKLCDRPWAKQYFHSPRWDITFFKLSAYMYYIIHYIIHPFTAFHCHLILSPGIWGSRWLMMQQAEDK